MPSSFTSPLKQSWPSILLFWEYKHSQMFYSWREKYFYEFKQYQEILLSCCQLCGQFNNPGNCALLLAKGWCWLWMANLGLQREMQAVLLVPTVPRHQSGVKYIPWLSREVSGLEMCMDADLCPEQFHNKLLNAIKLYSNPAIHSLLVATPSYNHLSSPAPASLLIFSC